MYISSFQGGQGGYGYFTLQIHQFHRIYCKYLFTSWLGFIWKQFETLPRYPIPGKSFPIKASFIIFIVSKWGYGYFTLPVVPYWRLSCKYLLTSWPGWGFTWEQFETPGTLSWETTFDSRPVLLYISNFQGGGGGIAI